MKVVMKITLPKQGSQTIECDSIDKAKKLFLEILTKQKCDFETPANGGPFATLVKQGDYEKSKSSKPEWIIGLDSSGKVHSNWLKG